MRLNGSFERGNPKSIHKSRFTTSDTDSLLAGINIELIVIFYVNVFCLSRKGSRKKRGKKGRMMRISLPFFVWGVKLSTPAVCFF